MTYKVIGLMSGSSLDGLDIAYVHLTEQRGAWSFELKAVDCIPYSKEWIERLRASPAAALQDFFPLHAAYGKYTGECVSAFIEANNLAYAVDFVSSHGHTVFHNPSEGATFQLGDGAAIAVATGLSVVSDLRAMDVALGGQGAPIVPIGDALLFPDYNAWLNLGGIANITLRDANESLKAFDICACNQVLNRLAARAGKEFDEHGDLARSGTVSPQILDALNAQDYFGKPAPKSLSNPAAIDLGQIVLEDKTGKAEDLLRTFCMHIAAQIADSANNIQAADGTHLKMLATGGGALNTFLMEEIRRAMPDTEIVVPSIDIIQCKEAIVMALIGALRWRGDVNGLASVTGAARDSIGGAIWSGQ